MATGVHRGAAAGSFSGATLSGYRLGPVLGAGSYGEVRLAYPKGHKHPVAIKAIDKTSVADVAEVERVTREFFILQSLDHRHVIKMREVLSDDERLYLCMEFAGGGSLETLLAGLPGGCMPEEDARKTFAQIASAVRYCHRKNVVHRDLKPDNILLAAATTTSPLAASSASNHALLGAAASDGAAAAGGGAAVNRHSSSHQQLTTAGSSQSVVTVASSAAAEGDFTAAVAASAAALGAAAVSSGAFVVKVADFGLSLTAPSTAARMLSRSFGAGAPSATTGSSSSSSSSSAAGASPDGASGTPSVRRMTGASPAAALPLVESPVEGFVGTPLYSAPEALFPQLYRYGTGKSGSNRTNRTGSRSAAASPAASMLQAAGGTPPLLLPGMVVATPTQDLAVSVNGAAAAAAAGPLAHTPTAVASLLPEFRAAILSPIASSDGSAATTVGGTPTAADGAGGDGAAALLSPTGTAAPSLLGGAGATPISIASLKPPAGAAATAGGGGGMPPPSGVRRRASMVGALPSHAASPAAGASASGAAPALAAQTVGAVLAAAWEGAVAFSDTGMVLVSGDQVDYTPRMADMWSCGVILYRMVTGHLPFPADSLKRLKRVMFAKPPPMPKGLSPELQGLLRRLLHPDPFQRLTADGLMGHPWVKAADNEMFGFLLDDDDATTAAAAATAAGATSPLAAAGAAATAAASTGGAAASGVDATGDHHAATGITSARLRPLVSAVARFVSDGRHSTTEVDTTTGAGDSADSSPLAVTAYADDLLGLHVRVASRDAGDAALPGQVPGENAGGSDAASSVASCISPQGFAQTPQLLQPRFGQLQHMPGSRNLTSGDTIATHAASAGLLYAARPPIGSGGMEPASSGVLQAAGGLAAPAAAARRRRSSAIELPASASSYASTPQSQAPLVGGVGPFGVAAAGSTPTFSIAARPASSLPPTRRHSQVAGAVPFRSASGGPAEPALHTPSSDAVVTPAVALGALGISIPPVGVDISPADTSTGAGLSGLSSTDSDASQTAAVAFPGAPASGTITFSSAPSSTANRLPRSRVASMTDMTSAAAGSVTAPPALLMIGNPPTRRPSLATTATPTDLHRGIAAALALVAAHDAVDSPASQTLGPLHLPPMPAATIPVSAPSGAPAHHVLPSHRVTSASPVSFLLPSTSARPSAASPLATGIATIAATPSTLSTKSLIPVVAVASSGLPAAAAPGDWRPSLVPQLAPPFDSAVASILSPPQLVGVSGAVGTPAFAPHDGMSETPFSVPGVGSAGFARAESSFSDAAVGTSSSAGPSPSNRQGGSTEPPLHSHGLLLQPLRGIAMDPPLTADARDAGTCTPPPGTTAPRMGTPTSRALSNRESGLPPPAALDVPPPRGIGMAPMSGRPARSRSNSRSASQRKLAEPPPPTYRPAAAKMTATIGEHHALASAGRSALGGSAALPLRSAASSGAQGIGSFASGGGGAGGGGAGGGGILPADSARVLAATARVGAETGHTRTRTLPAITFHGDAKPRGVPRGSTFSGTASSAVSSDAASAAADRALEAVAGAEAHAGLHTLRAASASESTATVPLGPVGAPLSSVRRASGGSAPAHPADSSFFTISPYGATADAHTGFADHRDDDASVFSHHGTLPHTTSTDGTIVDFATLPAPVPSSRKPDALHLGHHVAPHALPSLHLPHGRGPWDASHSVSAGHLQVADAGGGAAHAVGPHTGRSSRVSSSEEDVRMAPSSATRF